MRIPPSPPHTPLRIMCAEAMGGIGENLAFGYASLTDAIDDWYKEAALFDFDRPTWSNATGHFTQLVWRSTTGVGCAVNPECEWATYTCHYIAPGNVIGSDWSTEVLRATAGAATAPPLALPPSSAAASPSPARSSPAASPTPLPSPSPASSPDATSSPSTAPVAPLSEQAIAAAIAAHTRLRSQHGVGALVWNTSLALEASAAAAMCPPANAKPTSGSNTAAGVADLAAAVEQWYAGQAEPNRLRLCSPSCTPCAASFLSAPIPSLMHCAHPPPLRTHTGTCRVTSTMCGGRDTSPKPQPSRSWCGRAPGSWAVLSTRHALRPQWYAPTGRQVRVGTRKVRVSGGVRPVTWVLGGGGGGGRARSRGWAELPMPARQAGVCVRTLAAAWV